MRPLSPDLTLATIILAAVSIVHAQTAAPVFEMASIRPNPARQGARSSVRPENDRLTIVNLQGRQLLTIAFHVDANQFEGVPSWLGEEHYDITTKAAAPFSPPTQWQDMLRTLLEERFRLRIHHSSRDVPGFALVLSRADGALGRSLRRAEATCAKLRARPDLRQIVSDPCGAPGNRLILGTLSAHGLELSQLIGIVRDELGSPVRDETGLTGAFDWDLKWTPPAARTQPLVRKLFPATDPDGPALGTALEEQLGLRLEARRTSLDVIVVDHVERPSLD
jgi:uncharacterized protein (TIGR03435 family)